MLKNGGELKLLPKHIENVIVPPIKCQGIKTKLVNFIANNVVWDGEGRWIEPFLGSGVVLFNIQPERALISDKNEHIINFYKGIQSGYINPISVREFLEYHGKRLNSIGEDYYYQMRDEFNRTKDPLHFLFLSRACFNGVMRFSKKGKFNVPFCKKNDRFRPAYVTKIVNQIDKVLRAMLGRDWVFQACDWRETMQEAAEGDFIYIDPPYIGRSTGYIGDWEQDEANELAQYARTSPAGFALSMWKQNKYRVNTHIEEAWGGLEMREFNHFYHVGSSENLRNAMVEALIIKDGYYTEQPVQAEEVSVDEDD